MTNPTGNYLLSFGKINFQSVPNVNITSCDEKGRVSQSGFPSKTQFNVVTFNVGSTQNPHDLGGITDVACDGNFTAQMFGK
jgi:hypothetical protein